METVGEASTEHWSEEPQSSMCLYHGFYVTCPKQFQEYVQQAVINQFSPLKPFILASLSRSAEDLASWSPCMRSAASCRLYTIVGEKIHQEINILEAFWVIQQTGL